MLERCALVGAAALTIGVIIAAGCTDANDLWGVTAQGQGSAPSGTSTTTTATATNGAGGSAACTTANACPGSDGGCTPRACVDGKCTTNKAAKDTPCTDAAGKFCDGMGSCVECNSDGHCPSTAFCSPDTQACRMKDCKDGKKDNAETDVDCGGPQCDPCDNPKSCAVAKDCKSGFCKPNGGGGGASSSSGSGGSGPGGVCTSCAAHADCSGKPGTYCLNGSCVAQKNPGDLCMASVQCSSSFCVEGVCCDSACATACVSCLAKNSGGKDGSCAAVTLGADPDNECIAQAMSTCGTKGTGCNGDKISPQCVKWDSGTVCLAKVCKDVNTVTAAGTCDGKGTCTPGTNSACTPYKCAGNACLTSCAIDADCAATAYCAATVCTPTKNLGVACGGANQCTSGFCADGVCCSAACNGSCDACTMGLGAPANGTCTVAAVKNGTKAGSCDANNGCANKGCSCNGGGLCKSVNGASCANGATCVSGFCADGVCCNTACSGACDACTVALGAAVNGTCAAKGVKNKVHPNVCDANNFGGSCLGPPCGCSGGAVCRGAPGAPCGANSNCLSNSCNNNMCD